ncbi:MAG: hypothetical protein Q7T56_11735 [Nocardioidaceae bacterium]|nr:hypothetical protein [Nocardioidaceae bacterium]
MDEVERASTMSVERRDAGSPEEAAYLDAVFGLFDTIVASPEWHRWWRRADEGHLTLRVDVGGTRNYPKVLRVDGGVVGAVARRDLDFPDAAAAALVAEANVRHLAAALQELLDLKVPPDL